MQVIKHSAQLYSIVTWIIILLGLLFFPAITTLIGPYFFIVLMVLFGVTHGINDLEHLHLSKKFTSKNHLVLWYGAVMLFVVLGWFFMPIITLLLFIIISAYHFWTDNREKYPSHIYKVAYPRVWWFWLLFWLFFLHRGQVVMILEPLIWNIEYLYNVTQWIWMSMVVVFLIFTLLWIKKDQSTKSFLLYEIVLYGLIFLIALTWDLYRSFWFYFWICHSLPEIISVKNWKLNTIVEQYKNFVNNYRVVFLLSIVFVLVRFYAMRSIRPEFSLLLIFFMFLAIVTFPHVLLALFWPDRE